MNRQQAKELLPVIQAFAEGKTIEFKSVFGNWTDCNEVLFNYPPKNYRVKQEPKYRPFENKEECLQEMLKHKPYGWVKADYGQFIITEIRNSKATIGRNDNLLDFDYIFSKYTFADGAPFGIKDE